MSYEFRPAVRENVPLLIGLAGGTGSGKTMSAMLLAKGLAGGQRFAVIDTENGRARLYADDFDFDDVDLRSPFTPDAYGDAIEAADQAGYPVILVDSMSHEWAGDGGILDWQEQELHRMAGEDYAKRDAMKFASWIKPKQAHKRMVSRMLQTKAHLILCFRAGEQIEIVKEDVGGRKKTVVKPKESRIGKDGWVPITEKNLPFELTLSFLLTERRPGVPEPIKLMEQHRAFFPPELPITADTGAQLAAWAAGGATSDPLAGKRAELLSLADQWAQLSDFDPATINTSGKDTVWLDRQIRNLEKKIESAPLEGLVDHPQPEVEPEPGLKAPALKGES